MTEDAIEFGDYRKTDEVNLIDPRVAAGIKTKQACTSLLPTSRGHMLTLSQMVTMQ